jgi:hypothetical protein
MSLFENDQYRWRETYFVLFDAAKRPTLERMKQALLGLGGHHGLSALCADPKGLFESLTLLSPDDFAALDICYVSGEEVTEQAQELAKEMKRSPPELIDPAKLKRLAKYDGRFDVLHFEQITELTDDDEADEMLDPGAMLLVLEALAKLTDGVAIDPQSGTMM